MLQTKTFRRVLHRRFSSLWKCCKLYPTQTTICNLNHKWHRSTVQDPTVIDDLNISTLHQRYQQGSLNVTQAMEIVLEKREDGIKSKDNIWIYPIENETILSQSKNLDADLEDAANKNNYQQLFEKYPLFGIPFAIKDNFNVSNYPTTAACPGYTYIPQETSPVVSKIIQQGAILIGKFYNLSHDKYDAKN